MHHQERSENTSEILVTIQTLLSRTKPEQAHHPPTPSPAHLVFLVAIHLWQEKRKDKRMFQSRTEQV